MPEIADCVPPYIGRVQSKVRHIVLYPCAIVVAHLTKNMDGPGQNASKWPNLSSAIISLVQFNTVLLFEQRERDFVSLFLTFSL